MLTLKGIDFGKIFCATGARGFYGEGYPFHRLWRHYGMDWNGTGFSGKTLTLLPRRGTKHNEPGNMPLKEDGVTPQELSPRCIWTNFRTGEMINAVGLSNFGAKFYLDSGQYQKIDRPFFISFMCMAGDRAGREAELREFCQLLKRYLSRFKAAVALQLNFGCPNSDHDLTEFYTEICQLCELAKSLLGIPVVVNCNALMPTRILIEVSQVADALWIGNTIPFKDALTREQISWQRFGEESPLRRRGIKADGGLSSPDCFPFTLSKIAQLRDSDVRIPIVGGNGIRTRMDIIELHLVGADAAFIGSLAVVRPRSMKTVIEAANGYF